MARGGLGRSLAWMALVLGAGIQGMAGPSGLPPAPDLARAADHLEMPLPRPAGDVFVLSGPSGAGKSTLAKRLVRSVPGLVFAVSCTTRPPRPGEREGVDYFFVDDAAFDRMLARGSLVEWVEIYGHRYGLTREWMQQQLGSGKDILMDLDTSGARTVRQAIPGAVTLFLLPPSPPELARRLRRRGTETPERIHQRLGQAKHEMSRFDEYDFLVVNRSADQAFRELEAVIMATRARTERRRAVARRILEAFD